MTLLIKSYLSCTIFSSLVFIIIFLHLALITAKSAVLVGRVSVSASVAALLVLAAVDVAVDVAV